jgi:hypothetical protein
MWVRGHRARQNKLASLPRALHDFKSLINSAWIHEESSYCLVIFQSSGKSGVRVSYDQMTSLLPACWLLHDLPTEPAIFRLDPQKDSLSLGRM